MGRLFDEKGKSREVVRKWLEKQTVRGADPDRATNLQRILHSGDEKMTKNPVQASEKASLALCDHGQDQVQASTNFPVQLTEVRDGLRD